MKAKILPAIFLLFGLIIWGCNGGSGGTPSTGSGGSSSSNSNPGWTQLNPTGGPPHERDYGVTVAGDGQGNLILFGGAYSGCGGRCNLNDTWVLSHANGLNGTPAWTQLLPNGTLPAARDNQSGAYDSASNRLIIFGGCLGGCTPAANDVWVLSNANGIGGTPAWTQLSPAGTAPQPRINSAVALDAKTDRLIVFGGQDGGGAGGVFTDAWILTDADGLGGTDPLTGNSTPTWIQLQPSNAGPAAGYQASAMYDPSSNELIIAGGSATAANNNAVWILSNANGSGGTPAWNNVIATTSASSAPPVFSLAWPVYDAVHNRGLFPLATGDLQQWLLDNANNISGNAAWAAYPANTGPAIGGVLGSAYDSTNNIMTAWVTSGSGSNVANQLWVLNNANDLAN